MWGWNQVSPPTPAFLTPYLEHLHCSPLVSFLLDPSFSLVGLVCVLEPISCSLNYWSSVICVQWSGGKSSFILGCHWEIVGPLPFQLSFWIILSNFHRKTVHILTRWGELQLLQHQAIESFLPIFRLLYFSSFIFFCPVVLSVFIRFILGYFTYWCYYVLFLEFCLKVTSLLTSPPAAFKTFSVAGFQRITVICLGVMTCLLVLLMVHWVS